jgi:flavin-dependent dehydrogenase
MTNPATITATAAAALQWDVVVIGAGPAGAVVARQLVRSGCRTLLLEAKMVPRDKVCGGCINARALSSLAAIGMSAALDDLPSIDVYELIIHCGRRRLTVPNMSGVVISRTKFDQALVAEAVRLGSDFLPATSGRLLPCASPDSAVRQVELSQAGRTVACVEARMVVIAHGLNGKHHRINPEFPERVSANSWIGLHAVYPASGDRMAAGQIHMTVAPGGYVGEVLLDGGMVNLAAAVSPDLLRHFRQPVDLVAELWRTAGRAVPSQLGTAHWHGTGPLSRRSRSVAGHRVVLVGDAAGYVEPFTGEGVAAAITGAIAAAELIGHNPNRWNQEMEVAWTTTYRRMVAQRQWLCSGLTAALHRPWMARWLFRIGARFPSLPGLVARQLNQPPAALARE